MKRSFDCACTVQTIARLHVSKTVRGKRQDQYQAEIEALLTRDGEEHTKLKIKLETDIQVRHLTSLFFSAWDLPCIPTKIKGPERGLD